MDQKRNRELRRELFFHLDGLAMCGIVPVLDSEGVLERIFSSGADVDELSAEYRANPGYLKLVEFSKSNPKTKIIFISTNSARGTHYTYFKEQAEAYLLSNHKSSIILKFPLFIGKGVIERIKNKEIEPYGTMEIITLDKVAETIEEYLKYEGLKRVFTIEGEKIQAKTVAEILKV